MDNTVSGVERLLVSKRLSSRIPILITVSTTAATSCRVCSSSGVGSITAGLGAAGAVVAITATTATTAATTATSFLAASSITVVTRGAISAVVVAVTAVISASSSVFVTVAVAIAVSTVVPVASETRSAATTTTTTVAAAVVVSAAVATISSEAATTTTTTTAVVSLRGTEVFSRGWSPRSSTASLFNAQSTALIDLTLETTLGGISLFTGNHLNETEAARLASVGIAHNAASLDVSVLFKEATDLLFSEAGVNAGDEEVRAGVGGVFFILIIARSWRRTTVVTRGRRCAANSAVSVAVRSWGARSLAWVRRLVVVAAALVVFVLHGGHVDEYKICLRRGKWMQRVTERSVK